jgi:hypothetical protein
MSIKPPKYYREKLNEQNINFFIVLDELIKMYPSYKSNPDYPEYQNMFAVDMGNFQKSKQELFLLKNSIENDSNTLNKNVIKMNKMIDLLENQNKNLREKYNISSDDIHSSEGLIDQKQELYNEKILNLIFLIVGVISVGVMNYKEK